MARGRPRYNANVYAVVSQPGLEEGHSGGKRGIWRGFLAKGAIATNGRMEKMENADILVSADY
jgi:hypothetical protein